MYPLAINTETKVYKASQVNKWASMQEGLILNEVEIKGKKNRIYRDKYIGKLDSLAKLGMTMDYVCKNNVLNCLDHPYPNVVKVKKP